MEAALFDPESGYYSANIRSVGRRGDFSTSASLNPMLAKAVAGWLRRSWRETPSFPRHVIEVGAGDGSLAADIAKALGWRGRRDLTYHIVETSAPLRQLQQERLAGQKRFQWHAEMPEALKACDGRAIIISNELVDAFPATLLQWRNDPPDWHEIVLDHDGERWVDGLGDAVSSPPESSLRSDGKFNEGQRVERHDSYFEWLHDWLPSWREGEMLTIDYGDTFPQLYHRRPRGTLRGYFAHQRFESLAEILARTGKQDITADVDFTDLEQRGVSLGLEAVNLCTQDKFIAAHTPPPRTRDDSNQRIADPHGPGTAFKVLHQRRRHPSHKVGASVSE